MAKIHVGNDSYNKKASFLPMSLQVPVPLGADMESGERGRDWAI